jgi:hypothetical protein
VCLNATHSVGLGITPRHRKLGTGDGEELGLTVDLQELFDQSCSLRDHQALAGLPESTS